MKKTTKEQEFTKIFDSHLNVIFMYFLSKTNNREQSKDLAQDTFLKTWLYLERNECEIKNIRAFLYKIANNTLVDYYRKCKTQSLDNLIENGFDPVDVKVTVEKQSHVQNILGYLRKLSEHDQQLIVWRFVDGLSPEQISENLQQSKNAVAVMVHRAVNRLRALAIR